LVQLAFDRGLCVITVVSLAFVVFWELRQESRLSISGSSAKEFFFSNALMSCWVHYLWQHGAPAGVSADLDGVFRHDCGDGAVPGRLVTMISMPVVGLLVAKVQPRYLIGFGLLV